MSSIPTFSYNIHDNDFVHESHTIPTSDGFNVDTPPDGVLAPTLTPDVHFDLFLDEGAAALEAFNAFLQFHMLPQTPNSWSPTSLTSTSTHLLGFSLEDTLQVFSELLDYNAQPFAPPPTNSSEVAVSVRRRGPNRRPRGPTFAKLMDNIPPDVQTTLQQSYEGCCESVNRNDSSTWQKHIFSNRHIGRLAPHQQESLPSFICPAYIAFHSKCKSAKAGRYDSAERHCRNCPGFLEMDSTANMFPVQITKGEHKVIRMFRSTAMCDMTTISQALNIRDKMLRMMSDEMTLVYGFNAMNINADSEEPFTF